MITNVLSPGSPTEIVYLVGAGISADAPVLLPTIHQFFLNTVKYCVTNPSLFKDNWNNIEHNGEPPRFEVFVDELRRLFDPDLKFAKIYETDKFNSIHSFLANQYRLGSCIITTNFDNCIENAIHFEINRTIYNARDLPSDLPPKPALIKVHGSAAYSDQSASTLALTIRALAQSKNGFSLFPNWKKYLQNNLSGKHLIVIGYSGSDDFDVSPILIDSKINRMTWVTYAPEVKEPKPIQTVETTDLAKRLSQKFEYKNIALNSNLYLSNLGYKASPEPPISPHTTIDTYLKDHYRKSPIRQDLLLLIFSQFNLHHLVLKYSDSPVTQNSFILRLKSLIRTGCYSECIKLTQSQELVNISDLAKCEILYFLSAAHHYMGQSATALSVANSCWKITNSKADDFERSKVLNHLAALQFGDGDYDSAEKSYRQSLTTQHSSPNLDAEATSIWGLSDIHVMRKNNEKAIKGYMQALQIFKSLRHISNMGWTYRNIGECYVDMRDTSNAFLYTKKAVRIFQNPNSFHRGGMLYALFTLTKALILSKKWRPASKAIDCALKELSNETQFPLAPEIIILYLLIEPQIENPLASAILFKDLVNPENEWEHFRTNGRKDEIVLARQALMSIGNISIKLQKKAWSYFFAS